jgi:hypothetical protein
MAAMPRSVARDKRTGHDGVELLSDQVFAPLHELHDSQKAPLHRRGKNVRIGDRRRDGEMMRDDGEVAAGAKYMSRSLR